MQRTMLQAKIHRARVTRSELHYEGSCAIDGLLLDRSGIREYEQIHIYDINNGDRIHTVLRSSRTDQQPGKRRTDGYLADWGNSL
jgi:aspartate 1-decarboxylase